MRGDAGDVLVVCGLKAEARIARGPGIRVVAGGGRSATLASRIEAEIDRGVAGLVSFGVAGALSPDLVPGTLIVANAVLTDGEVVFTDDRWSATLRRRVPDAVDGSVVGSDAIVNAVDDKARLLRLCGALAVDMESHVVARAAVRHALPFVVIRAVADPFDRALPPAAMVAMRDDGDVDLFAVLRSIAATPRQLPALLALARATRAATRTLQRVRRQAGDRLGYSESQRPLA